MAWWQTLSAASEGAETGSARAAANIERAIRLRQALANQQQRDLDQQTIDTSNRFPGAVGGVGLIPPGGATPAAPSTAASATAGGTSTAAPAAPAGVAPRGRIPYPNLTGDVRVLPMATPPPPPKPTLGAIYIPEEQSVVGTPGRPATQATIPNRPTDYYPTENIVTVDPATQSLFTQGVGNLANFAWNLPNDILDFSAQNIEAPVTDFMRGLFNTPEELAAQGYRPGTPATPDAMMNLPGAGATLDELQALQVGAIATSDPELAQAARAAYEEAMAAYTTGATPTERPDVKPLKSPEEYNLEEQQLLAARNQLAQQEAQAIAALEQRRQINTQSYQSEYTRLVQQADNARRAGNTQQAAALMQQADQLIRQYQQSDSTFASSVETTRSTYQSAYDQADYNMYVEQIERGTSEIANTGDPARLQQVLAAAEGRELYIEPWPNGTFRIVEFDREGNSIYRLGADKKPKDFTADEISEVVRERVDDEYRAQANAAKAAAAQASLQYERDVTKELALKAADRETELAKARINKDEYMETTAVDADGIERKYYIHKTNPSGNPVFTIKPGEVLQGGIETEDTLQVIGNGAGVTPRQ